MAQDKFSTAIVVVINAMTINMDLKSQQSIISKLCNKLGDFIVLISVLFSHVLFLNCY
jgi:hypothetical protein